MACKNACPTSSPQAIVPQDNMSLWKRQEATDPKYVKRVAVGRGFSTIAAHYQLRKATEEWGPYGQQWGFEHFSYEMVQTKDRNGNEQTSVIFQATFFYPGGSFPIVTDMPYKAGDDTMKKVYTSARSKALSLLGFSADVYEGLFDDEAYVKDANTKFGDMRAFKKSVLLNIESASDEQLPAYKTRLLELSASGTIPSDLCKELIGIIDQKTADSSKEAQASPGPEEYCDDKVPSAALETKKE